MTITFRPIFWASMAQARPVGPAPMTRTSVCNSGIGMALALGRVSSASAVRNSGMAWGRSHSRQRGFERNSETDDSNMHKLGRLEWFACENEELAAAVKA